MGHFQRATLYLSNISQFDEKQIKTINSMLTTYYNEIQSKQQKQLLNELSTSSTTEISSRVTKLQTYQMPNCIYAYFEFNPNLLQKNTTPTFLFGLSIPEDMYIKSIFGKGFDSEEMTHNIASIGYFTHEGSDIYFYLTGDYTQNVVFKTQLTILLGERDG